MRILTTATFLVPTAFDWNTLLPGIWRLGRSTAVFQAPECHDEKHHNKGTREHCRAALRFAAHEWAVGRPSVLWGAYVPEFAIVTNIIDGQAFEVDSYRRIAAAMSLPAREVLFISDVVGELDAASAAGMQTLLCVRPGNHAQPSAERYQKIRNFDEIQYQHLTQEQ